MAEGNIPGNPATVPPLDPARVPHHSAHPHSTPFSTPKPGMLFTNIYNGILLSSKKKKKRTHLSQF